MKNWEVRRILKEYNVPVGSYMRMSSYMNRVKLYQNETYNHFLTKALVSKYLFNKGYTILSEYPILQTRRPDILALQTAHEPLIVEIETDINKNHEDIGIDTIKIPTLDFSSYSDKVAMLLSDYFGFPRKQDIKRELIE